MLEFIAENWLNILLVIVGFSAFGVYAMQRRDQKRSAATLIKSQIDEIEKKIEELRKLRKINGVNIYGISTIISENMWEKYRHLFTKRLTYSERRIIQQFFDNAEQIERARQDIIVNVNNTWMNKSLVNTLYLGKYVDEAIHNPIYPPTRVDQFKQIFDPLSTDFLPSMLVETIQKTEQSFCNLSGTTAYKRLEKWAFDKK